MSDGDECYEEKQQEHDGELFYTVRAERPFWEGNMVRTPELPEGESPWTLGKQAPRRGNSQVTPWGTGFRMFKAQHCDWGVEMGTIKEVKLCKAIFGFYSKGDGEPWRVLTEMWSNLLWFLKEPLQLQCRETMWFEGTNECDAKSLHRFLLLSASSLTESLNSSSVKQRWE